MIKCVIADDSYIIRTLLRKIMENFGFEVLEAEDGEEVLSLCVNESPELIISDWSLPMMDGIDVLYKIRADKKIVQPKFIFCAAPANLQNVQQALDGGADDFILRPFDEEIVGTKLTILGLL